ncbi:MAG TPA: response regulator [Ktedonobacterales bacterium]
MSDAEIFARFIQELRSLLSAIESHGPSLATDASEKSRQAALSEVARLARAASHLARSFEAEDIAAVAEAMAWATGQSGALGQGARISFLSPTLVRETLAYLRRRADAFGDADGLAPPDAADADEADRLLMELHAQIPSTSLAGHRPESSAQDFAPHRSINSVSELTLDELALVQSFANADLRPRDLQADAQLLARVGEPPAFLAQTKSGASVPVFGGMTAEEFDRIPPEMKLVFVKESQNDLREIGQYVMDFEQRPEDPTALARMSYLAHKLKGSAATMGFIGFAAIAASFQDMVAAVQSRGDTTDAQVLSGLGRFLELFEIALASAQALEEPNPELVDDARALRDAFQRDNDTELPAQSSLAGQSHLADRAVDRSHSVGGALMLHVETRKLDVLMNQLSALAANRGAVSRNLAEIARVQSEMQVALARLREKSTLVADSHPLTYDNLAALARNGGAAPSSETNSVWASHAAARLTGPLASTPSNLQLEQYTEMDGALRALAEVVADITANYATLASSLGHLGRLTEAQEDLTREMQGEAMGIRLGRLTELTPRLRISARVAAADFGKMIEFDVQGDEIEIDRSLLEKLEQPLIQLVRNAIAHGVESPVDRVECGKPTTGKVCLRAYTVGSEVVIEVSDDGRGVNANLLVGAAIGAQLITPDEARGLSHEQAMSFMFHEGITTSQTTTAGYSGALAGTGIGLADVATTIRALKGTISIRSELGKGSTFEIRAPISLSMLPILEVRAAGQALALPFAMVESTSFIEPATLREVHTSPADSGAGAREWRVTVHGPVPGSSTLDGVDTYTEAREIPAYALAETLGFVQDPEALHHFAVLNLDGRSVALLVESVGDGDVREEVVRPLPRRMQRRAVRGVIVRPEDGEVALLIDPQEALARRLSSSITLRPARASGGPRATAPNVMVVDDSVTIRRTLEQMLTSAGFKTTVAHDGYEALEMMENELPAVVILDVEMPRLSGFELLRIMRTSPQYERVRVAMLTSRAADKHREYALGLGADAYLVKPCPQEILVNTIERLLKESESK